jgi:hypothetical protein
MVGDDPVSQKAFEDFAGMAARNIAIRNAKVPQTKAVGVVE